MALALPFDCTVAPNGYAWWYFDGLSADRRLGFTFIAFLGAIFSPRYFAARRRAGAAIDPLAHAAVNVCLYGERDAWAFTEYPRRHVERSAEALRIGATTVAWRGDRWEIDFAERTAPWRRPIRGRIRLTPTALRDEAVVLASEGEHRWYPMSPIGRFEAELSRPALRFDGAAYQDANSGAEPIERALRSWTWCRSLADDAGAVVLYDLVRRRAPPLEIGRRFRPDGSYAPIAALETRWLPRSSYGVARPTRSEAGRAARLARTLEDGPFYTRAIVDTYVGGRPLTLIQEWTDMDRFQKRWVQLLVPFKTRVAR